MYFKFILSICLYTVVLQLNAQSLLPKVESGSIHRLENFNSNYVSERHVDIWLPQGYTDTKKYGVIYMHDGQMLFDANQTWNQQAWEVDQVISKLLKEGSIRDFIVVGIWNDGKTRHQDYFPQKPYGQLTQAQKDTVQAQLQRLGKTNEVFNPSSDEYLKFLVYELKPYIDQKYAVHKDRQNTYIAGSSMGELISIYATCEYPDVFSGAACLSTHWVGTFTLEDNPLPDAFLNYLRNNLPDPKMHKIYFDCGDQTLDALYPQIQIKVDQIMIEKGFDEKSWTTKYFPGQDHSELAWSKRFHVPITFLLGK